MRRRNENASKNERDQKALKEQTSNPEPLYDKTDRNFERQYQGPQEGNANDPVEATQNNSSSSGEEEKDII